MPNDLSAFDAAQFSTKVVEKLDQVNVMLKHVNRDWEGDLSAGKGSTVYVRTLGNITMQDYSRGDTVNYEGLTPAREAFQVNDAKLFAFAVDDLDKAQNDINALDAYAERAAVSINNIVEAKILSAYTRAATANKITGASNAPIALDPSNVYGLFVQAGQKLDDQNVPSVGRYAIVDSKTKAAIAQSPDLIRSTNMGDQMVAGVGVNSMNRIGNIAGFETFWSAACPSDSAAKYLVFSDDKAIAYAAQLQEIEKLRLEITVATAIRGILLHDVFVSNEATKRIATVKIAK